MDTKCHRKSSPPVRTALATLTSTRHQRLRLWCRVMGASIACLGLTIVTGSLEQATSAVGTMLIIAGIAMGLCMEGNKFCHNITSIASALLTSSAGYEAFKAACGTHSAGKDSSIGSIALVLILSAGVALFCTAAISPAAKAVGQICARMCLIGSGFAFLLQSVGISFGSEQSMFVISVPCELIAATMLFVLKDPAAEYVMRPTPTAITARIALLGFCTLPAFPALLSSVEIGPYDAASRYGAIAIYMGALVFATLNLLGVRRQECLQTNENSALADVASDAMDIIDHAPVGFHVINTDKAVVRINQTELDWLGYSQADAQRGLKANDILSSDTLTRINREYPLLESRGWVHNVPVELVRKDKTKVSTTASLCATKGGMLRSVCQNVMQQNALSGRLNMCMAQLQALSEEASDRAVFACDSEGFIVSWPSGTETLFRWSAREKCGQHFSSLFASKDNCAETSSSLVISAGQAPQSRQMFFCKRNGQPFKARLTMSSFVIDTNTGRKGFVCVVNPMQTDGAQDLIPKNKREMIAKQLRDLEGICCEIEEYSKVLSKSNSVAAGSSQPDPAGQDHAAMFCRDNFCDVLTFFNGTTRIVLDELKGMTGCYCAED